MRALLDTAQQQLQETQEEFTAASPSAQQHLMQKLQVSTLGRHTWRRVPHSGSRVLSLNTLGAHRPSKRFLWACVPSRPGTAAGQGGVRCTRCNCTQTTPPVHRPLGAQAPDRLTAKLCAQLDLASRERIIATAKQEFAVHLRQTQLTEAGLRDEMETLQARPLGL